jgi:hypothetical protein
LRDFGKRRVEIAAVVVVYVLFLIVGLYTQAAATFDAVRVEILSPPDGMQFQFSPVELAAVVTNQKGPLSNVSVRITVLSLTTGEDEGLTGVTNLNGTVKVLFPAQSGRYAWYVATQIEGYPTIVSRPRSFSARLALNVLCLNPCSSKHYPLLLPDGYLDLQVMVTDMNRNPVESANVTFYVNSMAVYSELSNPRGIATVSWNRISPGDYTWFAIASKDDEVGASDLSTIVVR